MDLLLEWSADPHRVCLEDLFETYTTEAFERFRALGVDLTAHHALAEALAYHTSNKPLFGFVKRHRETDPAIQTELNIVLAFHAGEGNAKGVQLRRMSFSRLDWGSADSLRRLFALGVRWEYAENQHIGVIRRHLLGLSDYRFVDAVKLLATGDYCSSEMLKELGRGLRVCERCYPGSESSCQNRNENFLAVVSAQQSGASRSAR